MHQVDSIRLQHHQSSGRRPSVCLRVPYVGRSLVDNALESRRDYSRIDTRQELSLPTYVLRIHYRYGPYCTNAAVSASATREQAFRLSCCPIIYRTEPSVRQSEAWRRGRQRHNGLCTFETDFRPRNDGLNSTWRVPRINEWKIVVIRTRECATQRSLVLSRVHRTRIRVVYTGWSKKNGATLHFPKYLENY